MSVILSVYNKNGFTDLIINLSYLGDQIESRLRDGAYLGVNITYSREPEPLETLGGLRWARQHLGDETYFSSQFRYY